MMNKKFLNAVLCGALVLFMGTFSSCKDYDEDIAGLDNRLTAVEEATKKLQQQVEDAINNGKWIDYVEEQTSNFVLHLTGKNGDVETITIPRQGADVMYYFKVAAAGEGEGEGTAQRVWWYSTDGNNWQQVQDEATHSAISFNSASTVKESVTITSNESVYYVALGGVQTTIKVDDTTKLLAEDRENGILVMKLGELNYTILLEESLFRGLNAVQYRPMQVSSDETLVAVTLKTKSDETYTYEQPAWGYFRCLPATQFDPTADNVSYACKDLHVVSRSAGSTLLVPEKKSATVDENGILRIGFQPKEGFEDGSYYKTFLDVTMNGYTVSSDYFNVRKETHYIEEAIPYQLGVGKIDQPEGVEDKEIYFDKNNGYQLDDKIHIGFMAGDNKDQFKSLKELGFPITVEYTLVPNDGSFSIGEDQNTHKRVLVKNNAQVGATVTVHVKWTVDGETKPNCSFPVKFKVVTLEQPLTATDGTIQLNALESNYNSVRKIELSTSGIEPADWTAFKTRLNEYQSLTLKYRRTVQGVDEYLSPVKEAEAGADVPLSVEIEDDKLFLCIDKRVSFKDDIEQAQNLFVMGVTGNNVETLVQIEGGKTLYIPNVKVKYAPSVTPKAEYKIKLGDGDVITGTENWDISTLIPVTGNKRFYLVNTDLSFGKDAYIMSNQSMNAGCLLTYDLKKLYDIKPADLPVNFSIDNDNVFTKLPANGGAPENRWNEGGGNGAVFFASSNFAGAVVTNSGRYDGACKVNGANDKSNCYLNGGVPLKWEIGDTDLPEGVTSIGCERWLIYDPFQLFGQNGGWELNLGDYAKLVNNRQSKTVTGSVTQKQLTDGVVLQDLPINEKDLVLVNTLPFKSTVFVPWVWSDGNGKVHFASKEKYNDADPYSTKGQGLYYVWDSAVAAYDLTAGSNGKSSTTVKLKSGQTATVGEKLKFKAQYRYDAGASGQGSLNLELTVVADEATPTSGE